MKSQKTQFSSKRPVGEFTNVKQLFSQCFDACVKKLLMKSILCQQTFWQLPHGLVYAKYWGRQILPCVYPAQRGIGAGFYCLTGKAIAKQQRSAILVNPAYLMVPDAKLGYVWTPQPDCCIVWLWAVVEGRGDVDPQVAAARQGQLHRSRTIWFAKLMIKKYCLGNRHLQFWQYRFSFDHRVKHM
jgi:hypothetical protein